MKKLILISDMQIWDNIEFKEYNEIRKYTSNEMKNKKVRIRYKKNNDFNDIYKMRLLKDFDNIYKVIDIKNNDNHIYHLVFIKNN